MASKKRQQLLELAAKNPGYKVEARLLNEVLLDYDAQILDLQGRVLVLEELVMTHTHHLNAQQNIR